MSDLFAAPSETKPKPKAKQEVKPADTTEPIGILRARISGKLAGIGGDVAHIEQDFAMLKERIAYALESDMLTAKEKAQLEKAIPSFISAYKPGTLAPLVIVADSIQAAYEKRGKA